MKTRIYLILILLSILSHSGFSQVVLNINKNKREYKIFAKDKCYISTLPTNKDTLTNTYQIHIGAIQSSSDSTITLKYEGLNTIRTEANGKLLVDGIGYNSEDNITGSLKFSQIERIENFRPWFDGAAIVGWLSAVSVVTIAPLVSINYKSGVFNTKKFVKVGGISSASATIFRPLLVLSPTKKCVGYSY